MCPKCLKNTLCSCSNCRKCREERAAEGVYPPEDLKLEVYIDPVIGIFECPYCSYVYSACESMDKSMELYREEEKRKNSLNNN